MRLDKYLFENKGINSREKAQSLIKQGFVLVDGKSILKPSYELLCNENITILDYPKYVSRGAEKLLGAVKSFDLDFTGKIVTDIGASTGGFTQVALEKGAKRVYAVDVGKGELDKSLAEDEMVVNIENTDFRSLSYDRVKDTNMVIGDISFISLRYIMPKIKELFGCPEMVILFKPQFECGMEIANKYKGVIKNASIHRKLLKDFLLYLPTIGFYACGLTFSPIQGKSGNIEYLFYLNGTKPFSFSIDNVVKRAFEHFKRVGNK